MKKVKYAVSLTLVVLLLSSCGTIIGGKTTTINLQTGTGDSVRATVVSKGGVQEVTLPATVMVKRGKKAVLVTVKDKCYKPTTYSVKSTLNMWFLGNFITGGLIGTTTDAITGGLWDYEETSIVPVVKDATCK
ncbi:MAG: hypothetical protein LBC92_00480 [Rickettsiales bacterium]|jgi:hypothetical protein|nr:hypothetical protein [Rickettsiales bacterium]